jgi:hypothetical protein
MRQQRLPARHAVFAADGVGRRPCSAAIRRRLVFSGDFGMV